MDRHIRGRPNTCPGGNRDRRLLNDVPSRLDGLIAAVFSRKHQSALLSVQPIATWLFIITAALILLYLLLGGGTIILGAYLSDTVSSIDGGYRFAQGQLAHRDFHTPVGILNQLLFSVAFDLAGNYADSLAYSVVLPLLVFVPLTIFVTVTRYHYYIAIPAAAFILLLAASPLSSGDLASSTTAGLAYNRIGSAAALLLFLMYLPPHKMTRGLKIADGLVAALLVLVQVYLKITYGIVAVCFVIMFWLLLSEERRFTAAICCAVVIAVAGLLELRWHFHWAYLQDVIFISRSSPGHFRLSAHMGVIWSNLLAFTAVAGAAGSVLIQHRSGVGDWLFWLFCIGAAVFFGAFGHTQPLWSELPPLVAPLAVAAEQTARWQHGGRRAFQLYFLLVCIAIVIVTPVLRRATAVVYASPVAGTAKMRYSWVDPGSIPPALLGLRTADPDLASVDAAFPQIAQHKDYAKAHEYTLLKPRLFLFNGEYLATIEEGYKLLEQLASGRSVIVFDAANPFSFLLKLTPQKDNLLFHGVNYTFSRDTYVPPERLFHGDPLVMIPKAAIDPWARDILVEIYRPYIDAHYRLAANTACWLILEADTEGKKHRIAEIQDLPVSRTEPCPPSPSLTTNH